jgi:hypothetical protein
VCELPAVECLVQRHAQLVDIGEPGDVLLDAAGDRIEGVGVHSFPNTKDCEDFVAGVGRGRAQFGAETSFFTALNRVIRDVTACGRAAPRA